MTAERIKILREQAGMSQEKLAKRLGITRSSVNAWEMGISTPSTQYIAELAGLFQVSADYLLGLSETATVSIAGRSFSDLYALFTLFLSFLIEFDCCMQICVQNSISELFYQTLFSDLPQAELSILYLVKKIHTMSSACHKRHAASCSMPRHALSA